MSEKRCFYEVLGLARGCSEDEIRKAYRQAALKFHPDRNPDDPGAAEKFKEATEAFGVLSDEGKRGRYDQFGHAGVDGNGFPGGGMGDVFSHFQDLFSELFGGAEPGRAGRRANGPRRGADIRVQERLTLRDAVHGCKREVVVRAPVACDGCSGSGAAPGTKREVCSACGGSGSVSTARGFVVFSSTCGHCRGAGSTVAERCEKCHGQGQVEKVRRVVVSFPAGIDTQQRLRVPGQGVAGAQGGPPGDLYVDVEVEEHERFERDGVDLHVRSEVSYADAALGTTVEVEMLDGSSLEIEVPAGTQPGDVIAVRGRGVQRIDGRGRGSLHVHVQIHVPRKLSARAKTLLAELEEELVAHHPKKRATTA